MLTHDDPRPLVLYGAARTSPLGALPPEVARAFNEALEAPSELFDVEVVCREPEGLATDVCHTTA